MNSIFQDETKIKIYSQIQTSLCDLEPNASDEDIDEFLKKIPPSYLSQKDDLMMICQLFAYSARILPASMKGNHIKLFERIMDAMKKYLQDESSFFWKIFGGLFYFKLWMHEEGLISIEQIILSAQNDQTSAILEYFLPEIIEEEPEIFEKEIKFQIKFSYSQESIQKFKEMRRKHWKWLRESGNYHDPSYLEIEQNRLRLAIKTDDVDSFQRILSSSSLSVHSKIRESTLENFLRNPDDLPLIEYALHFNSINIFKFLFLNDVEINDRIIYGSIQSKNYEIIHIVESKIKKGYGEDSLPSAIECWNNEMIEYSLDNYNFDFFQNNDIKPQKSELILSILSETFYSLNFSFFDSTLLPFIRNNPKIIEDNLNDIIMETFPDMACFFAKEFLKYPGLNINYRSKDYNISFLSSAIIEQNTRALELLLNSPNVDVNLPCFLNFPILHLACKFRSNVKILKMICSQPNFKINARDKLFNISAFVFSVTNGNFYALKYMVDNFADLKETGVDNLFYFCLKKRNLYTLKIILKYYMNQNKDISPKQILSSFIEENSKDESYCEKFVNELKHIIDEIATY